MWKLKFYCFPIGTRTSQIRTQSWQPIITPPYRTDENCLQHDQLKLSRNILLKPFRDGTRGQRFGFKERGAASIETSTFNIARKHLQKVIHPDTIIGSVC